MACDTCKSRFRDLEWAFLSYRQYDKEILRLAVKRSRVTRDTAENITYEIDRLQIVSYIED